ncbi:MAG: hypothetical protein RBR19_13985 [Sedimentisphaerales bacterium]|jgi:hypothetical protein|nr:hypothetical protein [Sedimentisphaerales bacterium]NLT77421.1 hypothetical protein [Planctomycetota bacterium]
MKKLMILIAVTSLLCGLAFANGNGAQKVDLYVSDNGAPVEPVVGWVIFNVNAEGIVIAQVHINKGEEGTYDARLNRGTDDSFDASVDVQPITVNKAGKGNAHLSGGLETSTQARLNILPEGATNQPNQIYTTGWVDL